jgi:hypothetical protein
MSVISPMPSPSGTNYEKLFILRGRGSTPQAAYDSRMTAAQARAYGERQARRLLGLDSTPDGSTELPVVNRDNGDDVVSQLVAWCRDNLNPDECRQLIAALNDTDNMTMDRRRQRRGHAMDSAAAARDYAERFPDAASVRGQRKW